MVLHLLTGFSGRIGRGAFWLGVAIMFAIQLALSFLWVGMFHSTGGTETERAMGWLALAVLLWVSAFWLLSWALWIWVFVELGCMRGTIGANRFGPDPLADRAPQKSE